MALGKTVANKKYGVRVYSFGPAPAAAPLIPQTNLIMWLKADADVYQDVLFTTPSVANGDLIKGWKDQSPAANNATTSQTGIALETPAQNSKPAAKYDGTSYLNFLTPLTLAHCEIFVVAKNTDATGSVILGDVTLPEPYYFLTPTGITIQPNTGATAGAACSTGYVLGNASVNGTLVSSAVNGGAPTTAANTSGVTWKQLGGYSVGSLGMQGSITEIIIYSEVQSAGDRTSINSYLNSKYAIF